MNLKEQAKQIKTKEDLTELVLTLRDDLRNHPENWNNKDLQNYLESLSAWIKDMDGYYQNKGENISEIPVWRLLGEMLIAASVYE
jgi:hypothetical protein